MPALPIAATKPTGLERSAPADSEVPARAVVDALEKLDDRLRAPRLLAAACDLGSPFLAGRAGLDLHQVLDASLSDLFALGGSALAPALALADHCATLLVLLRGVTAGDPFDSARARFTIEVLARRTLVADAGIEWASGESREPALALEDCDGRIRVAGTRRAVLLASVADVAVFSARHASQGRVLIALPLRRNPHVVFGPEPRAEALRDAAAATIRVQRLPFDPDACLASLEGGAGRRIPRLLAAARDVCSAAASLGTAQRALEEARAHLLAAHADADAPDPRHAAIGRLGRLLLRQRAATLAAFEAAKLLALAFDHARDGFALDRAAAACTAARAEAFDALSDLTLAALRLVGPRVLVADQALERIARSLPALALLRESGTETGWSAGVEFLRRA